MIKAFKKYALMVAVVVIMTAAFSSCVNTSNLIFEDDEWSGADFNGESLLLNGELELDDYER
ncbi:MAG: hypothetical protein J5565_06025 [Muribaculaceae bacterium]|nr:hypothetical protein [Muribaculaceae bacterium]